MSGPFLNRALLVATLIAFITPSMELARANPVIDWNIVAIDATAVPPNSVLQSRTLAIVHGAIFDASGSKAGKVASLKRSERRH
jgi:hypothetical protein